MFLSILLRGTLLLLLADHSFTQEWYRQEEFGPEYYAPNVAQDPQAFLPEKRDAENLVNASSAVHLGDSDYESFVRQKREIDNDDTERSSDFINHASSEVTENASENVVDHLNGVSDRNVQSNDEYNSLESNMTTVEANDTYEAGGGMHSDDVDNDMEEDSSSGNETTSSVLDSSGLHGDVMQERDDPTDIDRNRSETTSVGDEAIQESSVKHPAQEEEEVQSTIEDKTKQEKGNVAEPENNGETSEEEEGSRNFPKERFLTIDEEDEQPVKRQNLGIKTILKALMFCCYIT